jgi:hypothetical protein
MKNIFFFALLIFGIYIPVNINIVNAYTVTDTNVFSIDSQTGVFIIDYAFKHDSHTLTMPLRAVRGTTTDDSALVYEVFDHNGLRGKGTAYAVVLSKTKIHDGSYSMNKGVRGDFRLLVLYTAHPSETGLTFSTHVTKLPFAFTGIQTLFLNPSELTHYTAGPILLLNGPTIQISPR